MAKAALSLFKYSLTSAYRVEVMNSQSYCGRARDRIQNESRFSLAFSQLGHPSFLEPSLPGAYWVTGDKNIFTIVTIN